MTLLPQQQRPLEPLLETALQKRLFCIWLPAALLLLGCVHVYFFLAPYVTPQEVLQPPVLANETLPNVPSALQSSYDSSSEAPYSDIAKSNNGAPPSERSEETSTPPDPSESQNEVPDSSGICDITKGDWVPDSAGPLYTNETCHYIQGHQNCMKNGRPDNDYLYWRWKPTNCDLPRFDATKFLELMRHKKMAFIGDSIARNHMQALLCALSQVEVPTNIYCDEKDSFVRWLFTSYNFTLAIFWSPYLVKSTEGPIEGMGDKITMIYLDVMDKAWFDVFPQYDFSVFSSGQWWFKQSVYYVNQEIIGCHACSGTNYTQVGFFFGLKDALGFALNATRSVPGYKGTTLFRTFSPDHFENGRWDNGGFCIRKVPFISNNTTLHDVDAKMYGIQMEVVQQAESTEAPNGSKLKLLDVTFSAFLRPDGHPNSYRQFQPYAPGNTQRIQNDCLHWCLPGPIDTWNEMILKILTE